MTEEQEFLDRLETVSSFVQTLKTDIRFVNSYEWAEPIFQVSRAFQVLCKQKKLI